ncbi:MAG: DUF4366 domain-containing protein [Lachnospiraceae bacterium]|nr:DUF4366 domain-containing protein [Lachnospiraceae bacterium]
MNMDDLNKIKDLISDKKKKDSSVLVWVLAIIGVIVVTAAAVYAVYRYLHPDYLEDLDDDFEDDDFEDDFEDEEDDSAYFED